MKKLPSRIAKAKLPIYILGSQKADHTNVKVFKLGQWWGHKWKSDSNLSGQAGFESRDGLSLFSIQNCCQPVPGMCQAFSNNTL